MRYNVMFMVSCVLTFLVLNNVEVEVEAKKKFGCNVDDSFQGTCGNNGKSACVNDFKKKLGFPNNIGIRCDCSDRPTIPGIPPSRKCACQHDC
ncbi:unnamed protein product [Brassica oleracea var. botrytis]|uniref:Uncharacterized protein n=2 Tax=Brassica oleracea TaxID=3712 RepID=A0A0D3B401_BRAOL|nr:PREDICTED: putative defensin-like protein 225 [Brassica oleracea var. oleracea]VDC88357.1 unnamed protein product [Brassica oleracea]